MKNLSNKELLVYLSEARILYSEYLQGYNAPEHPHYNLCKNYLRMIPKAYEEITELEENQHSPQEIIQTFDKWINIIASETTLDYSKNFYIDAIRKDIELVLGSLYKNYKFDLNSIRNQLKQIRFNN